MRTFSYLRLAMLLVAAAMRGWAAPNYEPYDFRVFAYRTPAGGTFNLSNPSGIAVDTDGTIYVAGAGDRKIWRVTPDGVATVFAGSGLRGFLDGSASTAQFTSLAGLTIDPSHNLFVVDSQSVRKISPTGDVTTFAGGGTADGPIDGAGTAARFATPKGIAADASGNLFVADQYDHLVRKITPAGVVTTLAGMLYVNGSQDGAASQATFGSLCGITVDAAGNVYPLVRNGPKVRKLSLGGTVSTVAGDGSWGSMDGVGTATSFFLPEAIAVDGAGNLFVADTENSTIRKITPGGVVTTLGGRVNIFGTLEGTGSGATFARPDAIAIGPNNRLYIVERDSGAIRIGAPAGTFLEVNDLFVHAITLTGDAPTGTGSNVKAAAETGEPDHAGYAATKSVWWEWTAPTFGQLVVSTAGSSFDTLVGVYRGSSVSNLTLIGENDEGGPNSTSRISVFVTPGVTYKIAVDGYQGATGSIAVKLSFTPGSTIYSTDFDSFPSGANWLGGYDGWYSTNVTEGIQGVFPDPSGSAAGRIGLKPTTGTGVYVLRPVNYDPRVSPAPVEFSTDMTIVDSTNGIQDHFHFLIYNMADELMAGLDFDNASKFVFRYDSENFVKAGAFEAGKRYKLSATIDFGLRRWTVKLGDTVLFTDEVLTRGVGVTKGITLGHIGAFWEIATAGVGGDNCMSFDNYRIGFSNSVPVIVQAPTDLTVATGSSAVFFVEAEGSGLSYQWKKDDVDIPGATRPGYRIPQTTSAHRGAYRVVVTNPAATVTSAIANLDVVATSDPGRLVNLSVRTHAGMGAGALLTGFVPGGNGTVGSKPLLIRVAGPTLGNFGVTDALPDPSMQIIMQSTSAIFASNNDWSGDGQVDAAAQALGAFPFSGPSSKDAALVTSVPSVPFSIKTLGGNGANDIVLVELYDATGAGAYTAATPRLLNVSSRAQVDTGQGVLICGFVIGGSTAKTVLIRGVGPQLKNYGVPGVLADPVLQLFQRKGGSDVAMAKNDNWGAAPLSDADQQPIFSQVGAFGLTYGGADAVMIVTLPPGVYSAQLSGAGNTTGVGLIEVYEVP